MIGERFQLGYQRAKTKRGLEESTLHKYTVTIFWGLCTSTVHTYLPVNYLSTFSVDLYNKL